MKLTKKYLHSLIKEELDIQLNEISSIELFKKSNGKERFFYDLLSDIEDSMGEKKYFSWLTSELKKFGFKTAIDKYSRAVGEETLFRYHKG
jgi:uncharacterized protein (DUF2252 family)